MKKFEKFKAFTLAEILVTLMIIGIIAALTIPSLIQNTKKNEYVAGLKKASSSLNQAVSKLEIEIGPVGKTPDWKDPATFWPLFTKEFNTTKICDNGQIGCFNSDTRYLNGTSNPLTRGYSMITADGMSYDFNPTLCQVDKGISAEDMANGLGRFIVDVNGNKPPNKYGEDLFFFCLVKNKGIVPAGTDNTANCLRTGHGVDCAARVLKESAINY